MLTPATKTGRSNGCGGHGDPVDDADEEVGREERAEEHDLRRDEEQHPEDRRRRPASSGSRSAGRDALLGVRGHYVAAPSRPAPARRRCAPPAVPSPCAAARQVLLQPRRALRAANVETMISSTRSSFDGLHRRRERIGVRDLTVRVDALAAQLGEARRKRRSASGWSPLVGSLCGEMMRKLAAPAPGALADAVEQRARRRRSRSRRRGRSSPRLLGRRRRRRARPGRRPRSRGCGRRRSGGASPTSVGGGSRR